MYNGAAQFQLFVIDSTMNFYPSIPLREFVAGRVYLLHLYGILLVLFSPIHYHQT